MVFEIIQTNQKTERKTERKKEKLNEWMRESWFLDIIQMKGNQGKERNN